MPIFSSKTLSGWKSQVFVATFLVHTLLISAEEGDLRIPLQDDDTAMGTVHVICSMTHLTCPEVVPVALIMCNLHPKVALAHSFEFFFWKMKRKPGLCLIY